MTWSLEIHHIDVGGAGDSTLILAKETIDLKVTRQRSMLVDGGLAGAGTRNVLAYLKNVVNLQALDVIVSTHYDDDHLGGLTTLLVADSGPYGSGFCLKTIVYDQGMPTPVIVKTLGSGRKDPPNTPQKYAFYPECPPSNVMRFFSAIGDRVHPTKNVFPAGGSMPDFTKVVNGQTIPDLTLDTNGYFLLGKELLWSQPTGPCGVYQQYKDTGQTLSPNEPDGVYNAAPAGAPTVTCVAANGYVLNGTIDANGKNGRSHLVSSVSGEFDANGKSLALKISFGNFNYYLGGDLTSEQEDGDGSQPGLMHYLAKSGQCVQAMKASHHGSAESTSQRFLAAVRPELVFISNGLNNKHGHPAQDTLDRLNACATVKRFFLTGPSIGRIPPINSLKGVVAGYWARQPGKADRAGRLRDGHILLTVNASAGMEVSINGDAKAVEYKDADDDTPLGMTHQTYRYQGTL